jgi:hypothetical protein
LLGQALLDCVPDLEVFEWSSDHWLEMHEVMILPLGSLKGLTKLTELAVDIELFTGHDPGHLPPHLSDHDQYLPASLETLRINRVPHVMLEQLLGEHEKIPITDFVHRTTKVTSLSTLEISLLMATSDPNLGYSRTELSERGRNFIPMIVSALACMGTTLRIWRQGGMGVTKLLYEPGFAAPWPY